MAVANTTGDESQLRHVIHQLMVDNKRKDVRLQALENLAKLCHEKERECEAREKEADSLREALERADSRIVQLNQMTGGGPKIGLGKGYIRPGVSKKVLESLAKDNAKYRNALEQITELGSRGPDVAVRLTKLHDHALEQGHIIKSLEAQLKELQSALSAVQSGEMQQLTQQVNRLTEETRKKERTMQAKHAFYEDVMLQYEAMRNQLEKFQGTSGLKEQGPEGCSVDGIDGPYTIKALKAELDKIQVSSADEDRQRIKDQHIHEELDHALREVQELNAQNKALKDRNQELFEQLKSAQECGQDYRTQLTSMRDEFEKVKRLLKESEENLKRMHNEKGDKVKELEMEQTLMQDQLKYYEEHFKREEERGSETRQKMAVLERQENHSKQEMEHLRLSIERYKLEVESMRKASKYFEDRCQRLEQERNHYQNENKKMEQLINKMQGSMPYSNRCGEPMFMRGPSSPMSVGARGGHGDLQVDGTGTLESYRKDSPPPPSTSPLPSPSDDVITCPYCGKPTTDFETHYMQKHGIPGMSDTRDYADMITCSVCSKWVRLDDLERHVKEHTTFGHD